MIKHSHTKSQHPSFQCRFLSLRRSPRQCLMEMRREAVTQLAGVGCQIKRHLFELIHHQPACAFIAAKLAVTELPTLSHAAHDRPHQQVWYVDGDGLWERGEFRRVGTNGTRVAAGVKRQNLEAADSLLRVSSDPQRQVASKLTSRHCAHWLVSTRLLILLISNKTRQAILLVSAILR